MNDSGIRRENFAWNLESWALESGAQGIQNPTKDWNPESKFH